MCVFCTQISDMRGELFCDIHVVCTAKAVIAAQHHYSDMFHVPRFGEW